MKPQLARRLLHPDCGIDRRNDRGRLPLPRIDSGKVRLLEPHGALRRHHPISVAEQQAFRLQQRQPGLDIGNRHRSAARQAFADELEPVERRLPLAQVAHRRSDRLRRGIGARLQSSQSLRNQRIAVARGQPHAAGDSKTALAYPAHTPDCARPHIMPPSRLRQRTFHQRCRIQPLLRGQPPPPLRALLRHEIG